ncbi:dyslexia-associated protein KIAA0319 homolog isoform X1 [Chiroxiphia lanceolata]|uniref:dyslexia-associated protein KIAA0319 homolog isoform X1 n=1 Tax=Chiroxiphia lanceolata TaxID=296741 RepID=UPI0013CF1E8E|nr:dyslexia-associated protein KIAA0319 homolog isoform X1 [Chiroxiphia lanceolata]XP_032545458.1 dyslexia-associated protein KIAA0319 homolog isoform X1 [Chiroxiphia lanceolata]XP_032545462.1 dyslexia-associated protein KIAA0319 homolog isoform X1 [Chiroxiphia lanceolata]XP_032545471.1 dyslexia-associated protein KIAA0319 homolog isoform X1 [Chiroxiphia lanceolata]
MLRPRISTQMKKRLSLPSWCSMAFGPGVLCLFLWAITGSSCEQCREGATYSGAVISPNLETTKIMRVPHAMSVSDCIAACCDLSGCDLSWMFEQRCYIVNCQHEENCKPKKIETVKSYLTFVLRPSQRRASLLGFGQVIPSMVHSLGHQNEPSEEVSSLKKLSLLGKDPSLEEIPEYIDDYKELEEDPFQMGIKHEQKESTDYADWGLMMAGENGFNATTSDDGDNQEDFAEKKGEAVKGESLSNKNVSELNSVTEHSIDRLSSLLEITPFPGKTFEREAAVQLLAQPDDALQKEAATPSSSSDKLDFFPGVSEKTQTPTVSPENVTEGGVMLLPTNTVPSEPMQQFTPPATAAKADMVKELIVSAGDNIQVMLPKNEVELNAFAVPPPSTETAYTYEWNLISHPADYGGEMEHRHSQTLKLSHLSVGLYAFKVTVSGVNAFGEGFVNVTVKPALRVNQPPVAVASPKVQEVSLPTTSTFIDGSQSIDDMKIVSYHWEEIKGPLREQKASADTPVLHLSNLVPGNYTFRLTVIDSDGAANSTIAFLTVNKPVDYPPIANAGPNQAVTLPQNFITLNGNQSSDDHEIVSYEWSLSPKSKGKVVAMQGVRTPYLQLSAMQEGDYTFQLTVTDSARQRSTAEVTLIVQPENNSPPVAVAGPDKELTFPVESATLDGSKSQDDQGIVFYHWENISGPSSVQMENDDQAIATVTGLQVGTYRFRLTVKDQQGLSSASVLSITVKEENNSPPRAHAGGKHVLVLPNNSVTLDGSRSADDQGIVSYLWIRDGQSPAAGDVIHGSDHEAVLQLTNLVEGTYTFHLKVTDAKGDSDVDSATVEVRPDPKRNGLVELILQVGVGQLSEQQKDTLVRQLAVLLNVLDSDIKVQKIQAYSDISTAVVFYVQNGHPSTVIKASDVSRTLHVQLLKQKADFLLFKVLRVDTAACLLKCSGHGHCDPITKRCICYQLWMENLIHRYLNDGESNCEWSILYVTVSVFILIVVMVGLAWLCICCCKSRKRTKIRRKTKYTILDNIDEQERMELRPKYGIKHRSTEHNSSLMVSESEFDSDQDTIFSREKIERENPRTLMNGSIRNGVSFNYSSKDR